MLQFHRTHVSWEDSHRETGDPPPRGGTGNGSAHLQLKSPETMANLPLLGDEEADALCRLQTTVWFVSHAYFQLKLAQVGDIIPGCCLDGIKAGTEGRRQGKHHRICTPRVLPTLGIYNTSVQ